MTQDQSIVRTAKTVDGAIELALLELGGDDVLEEHGGAPALAGGAGDDVVKVVGRAQ